MRIPGRGSVLVIAVGLLFQVAAAHPQTLYNVERVIDGDTIELKTIGKVRLIGVETPEPVQPGKPVEHFSKEAGDFLRQLLEGGQVWVDYDWQRKDKYGRTLAYVYLPDSTFVNAAIVRFGYGRAYRSYPFKYSAA